MSKLSPKVFAGIAVVVAMGAWAIWSGPGSAPEEQPQVRSEDAQTWHRLVGILQYLQTDYPAAVKSGTPSELSEQVSFAEEAFTMVRTQLGTQGARFLPLMESVRARVAQAKDPEGVSKDAGALVEGLIQAGGLSRAPRHTPDLAHAETLYRTDCAACHGLDGKSQVALAKRLTPAPANLQSGVMELLTPYKAFNVVTFGVAGTSMPAFPTLSDDERWELAFYLFSLRQPPCTQPAMPVSLERLANATDRALRSQYGDVGLACLRRNPPRASLSETVGLAQSGVEQAAKEAALGHTTQAHQALVDAYLNGVEPVEPLLRSRDPDLVIRIEDGFRRARTAVGNGDGRFERDARGLMVLLEQARQSGGSQTPRFWSVLWLSLLVLLREGFEATVVVAALLAFLKKTRQEAQARVVNLAWALALAMGALAYIFGRRLFAGTDRELLEGWVALAAAAMLIYAALWLNARTNMRRFMGELREKMQGALGRGSSLSLFFIAFMAVFRESLETAVFLEGLSIDSARGAAWGAVAGLLVMVAFTLFVNRMGYRLPMKAMFSASTVLLYVTAIVLLGKGVHSLQEVGLLPLHPMRMWTVDLIGLYPDAFSFLPQLLLALAPWVFRGVKEVLPESPQIPANGAHGRS